jgi:hypothetical protein
MREGKKVVKPIAVIIAVIALFFGSIFALQTAGVYKLLPDKSAAGEILGFDEVKGCMTIEEAADATKTDIKEFMKNSQSLIMCLLIQ